VLEDDNEDWFLLNLEGEGTLALEIAFDDDKSDMGIALFDMDGADGPLWFEADPIAESTNLFTDYETIAVDLPGGQYLLRVKHRPLDLNFDLQYYTLYSSYYPN